MRIPQLIQGNVFVDQRGTLKFMNDIDLSPIKRFYTIQNANTEVVRAWQGHKIESKWFFVMKGSFKIGAVEINNFENPDTTIKPSFYELTESNHQILLIPKGYANGFIALEPNSVMMVFSDHSLEDCKDDNFRLDATLWSMK